MSTERPGRSAGRIDVSFNAVAVDVVQGIALTEIGVEDFLAPVTGICRTNFLAGEVGRQGVRVAGIRASFTPETYPGVRDEDLGPLLKDTLLGHLPRLAELAGTAVYLASDAAGAVTGAIVNLTCGAIID